MEEEVEKEDKKNEIFNIKINFYDELIDIQINSDYNSFITKICNIFQIPKEQSNSLSFSYLDEDDDSIILSTEEDYILYIQQLKEKLVNTINVEIKENSEINPISCFGSALNYQEQINQANNQLIEENNINIMNNNIFNNNDINNLAKNNEQINYDVPVDDIIFNYKCTSCSLFPIICTLYYCPFCPLYVCEDCIKKFGNHTHHIQKYESNNELMKVKEQENNEIERMNQIKNNQNNFNDLIQFNNNPNVNNSNYNFGNDNQNLIESNLFRKDSPEYNLFHFISSMNPFKLLKEKKIKYLLKKHKGNIKNISLINKAKIKYKLEGVDDFKLLNAIKKANGDIDKAITLL